LNEVGNFLEALRRKHWIRVFCVMAVSLVHPEGDDVFPSCRQLALTYAIRRQVDSTLPADPDAACTPGAIIAELENPIFVLRVWSKTFILIPFAMVEIPI
jgi:hypothetical protein